VIFSLLIHPDDKGRLYAHGVEFPSNSSTIINDDALDSLMNLSDTNRRVRLKPDAAIGGKKLVWLTTKELLDKVILNSTNPADKIRDMLGLVHQKPNQVLIALHFQAERIQDSVIFGRPTFADASTHKRFSTRAERQSNRKRVGWGHTVDLELLAANKPFVDGVPERIMSPISATSFNDSPIISFTPLNKIMIERGKDALDNDGAFSLRLERGRDESTLKIKMMDILS